MIVRIWWLLLSVVSVINIGVWVYLAIRFLQKKHVIHPKLYLRRKWVLGLSGVYVGVCAFRAFLPRIDLERICLVQTWLSNMFLGRSLATVAELSFIIQCAILLREVGLGTGVRMARVGFWVLIPMIVLAEVASWYAILTKNYLGSVIEESLWALAGTLLLIGSLSLWRHVNEHRRYYLAVMIIYAIGFVFFMGSVDIPMYWSRWRMETLQHATYLSLWSGLWDTLRNYTVNFSWHKWHQEIPWMTLYFTITVWMSMAFAFAPSYESPGTTRHAEGRHNNETGQNG